MTTPPSTLVTALSLAAAMALAGCTQPEPKANAASEADPAPPISATDAWKGGGHLVLMDAIVQRSTTGCYETPSPSGLPGTGTFDCAQWGLPARALIPNGSLEIYIRVDLGRMQNPGGYWELDLERTAGRDRDTDGSHKTGPVGNWTFPLVASDWDPPNAVSSAAVFELQAKGDSDVAFAIGNEFGVRIGVTR